MVTFAGRAASRLGCRDDHGRRLRAGGKLTPRFDRLWEGTSVVCV
jgi:hypothetical protein